MMMEHLLPFNVETIPFNTKKHELIRWIVLTSLDASSDPWNAFVFGLHEPGVYCNSL